MTTPPNQTNEEIIEKLIEEYCSFWDKNNPLLESSKKLLKEAMLLIANVKDSLHAQALKKIQREGAKAIEILMKQISEQEERHRGEMRELIESFPEGVCEGCRGECSWLVECCSGCSFCKGGLVGPPSVCQTCQGSGKANVYQWKTEQLKKLENER